MMRIAISVAVSPRGAGAQKKAPGSAKARKHPGSAQEAPRVSHGSANAERGAGASSAATLAHCLPRSSHILTAVGVETGAGDEPCRVVGKKRHRARSPPPFRGGRPE